MLKIRKKEFIICIICLIALFSLLLYSTTALPSLLSPDEQMRDDVPFWIAENNALPIGDEIELISNSYGFSYATLPFLPALISALAIKIAALVTPSARIALLALRMVNLIALCGCFVFSLFIGRKLFREEAYGYLYAGLCTLLPQVVFLASYYNNDMLALLGSYIVLYFWILGQESNWNIKHCIGLSIGLAIIILSYYNAYGWVLASILFCAISCLTSKELNQKERINRLISRGAFVFCLVFLLAGWFFVRNAILHDGDFLGRKTCGIVASQYEAMGHTIHHNTPPSQLGQSLLDMLNDGNWVPMFVNSFIGIFGNMNLYISDTLYLIYKLIIGVGCLAGLICACKDKKRHLLHFALLIGLVTPVILTIAYSYTSDYQPQGRYAMSMLPALMYFVVYGYEKIISLAAKISIPCSKKIHAILSFLTDHFAAVLLCIWCILFGFSFTRYYYPQITYQPKMSASMDTFDSTLDLTCSLDANYVGVQYAVWNSSDFSTLHWFSAEKQPNNDYWSSNTWEYTVNMSEYAMAGEYTIHVYGLKANGELEYLDALYVTAKRSAHESILSFEEANDGSCVITLTPVCDYQHVVFSIWEPGDTEPDWYDADFDSKLSQWNAEFLIDTLDFDGIYFITAYEQLPNGQLTFISQS